MKTTAFLLTMLVPAVASAMLWLWLFNGQLGLINLVLRHLGITNPPEWLSDVSWAMPALVLAGAQDKSAPADLAMQPIAAALPRAEYRLIDPGSHLMAIEQPENVVEAISTFLQQVDA